MALMMLAAVCWCEKPLSTERLPALDPDGVSREDVVVPMVFPVGGKCSWANTFLAARGGGSRRHHGQDIMAPKMTAILATFDGRAYPRVSPTHNTLTLVGDNGWTAVYMHINNDTPGTDDGQGSQSYAFVPGLGRGSRVRAGDLIAYVGDSGNAEGTAPHLHFELHRSDPCAVVNPAHSLRAARRVRKAAKWRPGDLAEPEEETRIAYGAFSFAVTGNDILVEGEAMDVDSESGRVVIMASTVTLARGGKIQLQPSRRKAVYVSTDTRLYWSDASNATPDLGRLRESQKLCVIGSNLGIGSPLPAKYLVLQHTAEETRAQAVQ